MMNWRTKSFTRSLWLRFISDSKYRIISETREQQKNTNETNYYSNLSYIYHWRLKRVLSSSYDTYSFRALSRTWMIPWTHGNRFLCARYAFISVPLSFIHSRLHVLLIYVLVMNSLEMSSFKGGCVRVCVCANAYVKEREKHTKRCLFVIVIVIVIVRCLLSLRAHLWTFIISFAI